MNKRNTSIMHEPNSAAAQSVTHTASLTPMEPDTHDQRGQHRRMRTFMMLGMVAYRGVLRRRSVLTTAGSLT